MEEMVDIGIRYAKLFEAAKILDHVLFEHDFYLTKPFWESVSALTDHFADAFVRENFARVYDVVTFESLTLTSFYLEKSCVRKGIF